MPLDKTDGDELAVNALDEAVRALHLGDPQSARRWARHAISQNPQAVEAWLILAQTAEPQAKVAYLEQAVRAQPENPVALEALHLARQSQAAQLEKALCPAKQPAAILTQPRRSLRKLFSLLLSVYLLTTLLTAAVLWLVLTMGVLPL